MKLLVEMVAQFKTRHKTLPRQIILTPAALAALAVKRSVALRVGGVPVVCREIERAEVTSSGPVLGVAVHDRHLVCFDLNS